MEKKSYVWEVCPHCNEEVQLDDELMVQTCPTCGRRIVTCSMCRACDANDGKNYCSNCCLSYQADKENEEANWEYKGHRISFKPAKEGVMAIVTRISDGKDLLCVYGVSEKDARLEAEDKIDTREMAEEEEPDYRIDQYGEIYKPGESWPAGGGLDKRCDYNAEALFAFYTVKRYSDISDYLEERGFEEEETPSMDLAIFEKGDTRIVFESYVDGMYGYVHTEYIKK